MLIIIYSLQNFQYNIMIYCKISSYIFIFIAANPRKSVKIRSEIFCGGVFGAVPVSALQKIKITAEFTVNFY